jgi:1-acyl-sn-glycerol-3-phosphate acyltransferase
MDGFDLLARRTKAALLPLAFDGCFEAYPRNAWFPRPGNVQVVIGQPILFSQYKDLSQAETKALLEQRMGECFAEARRRLAKSAIGDS